MSALPDIDLRHAQAVANGEECLECQRGFTEPHGVAVVCRGCWAALPAEDKGQRRRAWHDIAGSSVDREHFAAINRKKKQSKWASLPITTTKTDNG